MTKTPRRRSAPQDAEPAPTNIIDLQPFLSAARPRDGGGEVRSDVEHLSFRLLTFGDLLIALAEEAADLTNGPKLLALLDELGRELGLQPKSLADIKEGEDA